jgi:hypothetical protein
MLCGTARCWRYHSGTCGIAGGTHTPLLEPQDTAVQRASHNNIRQGRGDMEKDAHSPGLQYTAGSTAR